MSWFEGLGAPLRVLACVGREVRSVRLEDNALLLDVPGVGLLKIFDAGQSCCELRYMRTDDDLDAFGGATLIGVEVRIAPTNYETGDPHEVAFLVVHTSKGDVTCSTHNEHNGYYAGFSICAVLS